MKKVLAGMIVLVETRTGDEVDVSGEQAASVMPAAVNRVKLTNRAFVIVGLHEFRHGIKRVLAG